MRNSSTENTRPHGWYSTRAGIEKQAGRYAQRTIIFPGGFLHNPGRLFISRAACSIYYLGGKVLDLRGGYRDVAGTELWEQDTVVRVYSTTKGMSLVVLAKLHSDGLLDYQERVSTYWPS